MGIFHVKIDIESSSIRKLIRIIFDSILCSENITPIIIYAFTELENTNRYYN